MTRGIHLFAALATVAVVATACTGSPLPGPATTPSSALSPGARPTVVASTAVGDRDIGVLLRYRDGDLLWHCGAAVVASRSGDVIATAAHCVSTPGTTYAFAPGDTPSGAPLGVWPVVAVHTDPAWQRRTDPRDDIAFLTVRPRRVGSHLVTLQQVTGALELGVVPAAGTTVALVGYPSDRYGGHLTCTTSLRLTRSYPTVTCPYFTGGTSGSPFVGPDHLLVGVVGGLQSGGCTTDVTYTSPFTPGLRALLAAAEGGGASSPLPPVPGRSPCG